MTPSAEGAAPAKEAHGRGATATEEVLSTTLARGATNRSAGRSSEPPLLTPVSPQNHSAAAALMLEVGRLRHFSLFCLSIVITVGSLTFVLGGSPAARLACQIGCLLVAASAIWFIRLASRPERYTDKHGLYLGVAFAVGECCAIRYFGELSLAVSMLPIGALFFGLCRHRTTGFVTVGVSVAFYLCLLCLLATDTVSHIGLVVPHFSAPESVFAAGTMTGVAVPLYALFFARRLGRTTRGTFAQVESLVSEASRREALLLEARDELAGSFRIGGPGRYTGQVLGDYQLGVLIGRGGVGEVYDGQHKQTKERAAIKVLTLEALRTKRALERFVRERDVIRALRSPHIVELKSDAKPAVLPYIAMERLIGRSLSNELTRGELSVDRAIAMLSQIVSGLSVAHAAGIVHRDIKPGNLFLHRRSSSQHVWKILDFGISRDAKDGLSLTNGAIVGTPGYVAPEQVLGAPIDRRADVFSLALVAYRVLARQPAFRGSAPELLHAAVSSMPKMPSAIITHFDESVDHVFAIALAKDPRDRFGSARAFFSALRGALCQELARYQRIELAARARLVLRKTPWAPAITSRVA